MARWAPDYLPLEAAERTTERRATRRVVVDLEAVCICNGFGYSKDGAGRAVDCRRHVKRD